MARKALITDKFAVVSLLVTLQAADTVRRTAAPVSYFRMRQLQSKGLVTYAPAVKTAKKGKVPSKWMVTGKGRSLVALSKFWKQDVAA